MTTWAPEPQQTVSLARAVEIACSGAAAPIFCGAQAAMTSSRVVEALTGCVAASASIAAVAALAPTRFEAASASGFLRGLTGRNRG